MTPAMVPHRGDAILTMEISVIVPTYNRAGLLQRALDSVCAQSIAPAEVIVVDDGSDDDTAELVHRHFPAVRYRHQTNRGVSSARNHGIRISRGEWIALLDSDDSWHPHKLQVQRSALQARPGLRVCHTDEIWIRRGVRVNPGKKHAKSGGRLFQRCLPRCAISPSSVLIHRSVFEDVGGFDESLPVCEDYDLWLRICNRYPVVFVAEQLITKYGGHGDQLSRRYWGMDRFRVRALEKIIGEGKLQAADRAAATRMLLHKCAILLQGAKKRGNQSLARRCEAILARHQADSHRPTAAAAP